MTRFKYTILFNTQNRTQSRHPDRMGNLNSGRTKIQQETTRVKIQDNFYGMVETQLVSGRTEADLHKTFLVCKKNPGHKHFIPIDDFTIKHLPYGYQDDELLKFIKAVADLTVRVSVTFTSPNRPRFWPGTKNPYPYFDLKKKEIMKTGTGKIFYAKKFTPEDNNGTCPCTKCRDSDTPSKVWGFVVMYTASHVIFDNLEAKHSSCRLFFHRQGDELVCLSGWKVCEAIIKEDKCKLICILCDLKLLDKIVKLVKIWDDLWEPVYNKYKNVKDVAKLSFIVSHPHGCPKQVSVGRWVDRVKSEYYGGTRFTYSTSTCPGSSGALVHILGSDDGFWHTHVHCGVSVDKKNYSGVGRSRELYHKTFPDKIG